MCLAVPGEVLDVREDALRMGRVSFGGVVKEICLEYVPEAVVMHLERRVTRKLLSTLTARHVYGLGYFFWKHRYLLTRPTATTMRRAA